MATPERHLTSPNNLSLATALSLIIPGAGQFAQKHRWRGLLVLLITAMLGGLVAWALTNSKVGQISIGSFTTTWLWIPFILFWIWNILDSRRIASGKPANILPAILFAAIILYSIAFVVTDVKFDRLVTHFKDAQLVVHDLVNPELAVTPVNGEDTLCSWSCIFDYARDKLAGRTPAYEVKVSDYVQEIFWRITDKPAPKWQVNLGLAESGQLVSTFVAGKMIETIAIGLMATLFGTVIAIPLSFFAAHNFMSRVRGGSAIYYAMRTFFNIVRAIDTVVWGLIVIVWVGLGSFAGVIALTIHTIAALGKLYSEEIEHIDQGPVEALTSTGANLVQTIRFAVVPQIIPSFLAYTLLRWDINMRSATIIGFVAGGGIGFLAIETIRGGGFQQYATILWAVAVVIILVDYISARWRESILRDEPRVVPVKQSPWVRLRTAAYAVLGLALFVYCWNVSKIDLKEMFAPAPTFIRLVRDFAALDLTPGTMGTVIQQMLITIFQAMLATTLGGLLALPLSFLAAKNLTGRSLASKWLYFLTRGSFNVLRSIEALLYVAIFTFWVGIGSFAGMLALAITTFALIGKLFSEAIENIDSGPIEALNATGANIFQTIAYAILPQIVPPFVSYLIYQWDINIRMATIIGFAGGGGIGLTLSTFFGSLQYHKAGTVIAVIVIVVALMDLTSAKLRERLV